jgi:glutathione S-transferase
MKLFHATNSPFARKCRVVIIEKGLHDSVELVESSPPHDSAALIAANPLCRIPSLMLENGDVFCESPVICEYLDSLSSENILFPSEKEGRFEALRLAALGSGIMDSAVAIVMEKRRPEEKQYAPWIQRKEDAILRTIAVVSGINLDENSNWNIGTINLAVALSYVSFRMPHLAWKNEHKNLSNWLEFVSKKQSMVKTTPIG